VSTNNIMVFSSSMYSSCTQPLKAAEALLFKYLMGSAVAVFPRWLEYPTRIFTYTHTPWSIFWTFLETPAWSNDTSFQMPFFRLKDSEGVGKMAMVVYECGDSAVKCFVYYFNFAVVFYSSALLFHSVQRPNL
jgi:hypothetical protein